MAGLWTVERPKDADELIPSCAVVTTRANRDVAFVNQLPRNNLVLLRQRWALEISGGWLEPRWR